uniref:Uncharacterized protein n=1 Tax=uncultured Armatimonadetes bacterium TaxID=157466 RepID=A0A6J4HH80_9BACT|nr:hypothetical protein AVDCRST_MAG63-599 [uncultured Armatimonadetes bacterium]
MAGTGGGDAQATAAAFQQMWTQAVNRVKQEVIAPTLWRALEVTHPVAWEGNNFVVGMDSSEGQLAGQLNAGENRGVVERVLRSVTGNNDLVFRVVEGTSYADWEFAKARDAAARNAQTVAAQRRSVEAATFGSWDDIYEQVTRMWASSEHRSLPVGRGRYLSQALALVEKAMDTLYPKEGKVDEQMVRGLSRVLDRVASYTASDAALLAYLMLERRNKGGGS